MLTQASARARSASVLHYLFYDAVNVWPLARPEKYKEFSAELPHVQNSSPLAPDEAGVTQMIFQGGAESLQLISPLHRRDVMFRILWLRQVVLHRLRTRFPSFLLSSPLGACVLAAANRASHRDKMSQPQEQRSVSTEGTGNVENQAAREHRIPICL